MTNELKNKKRYQRVEGRDEAVAKLTMGPMLWMKVMSSISVMSHEFKYHRVGLQGDHLALRRFLIRHKAIVWHNEGKIATGVMEPVQGFIQSGWALVFSSIKQRKTGNSEECWWLSAMTEIGGASGTWSLIWLLIFFGIPLILYASPITSLYRNHHDQREHCCLNVWSLSCLRFIKRMMITHTLVRWPRLWSGEPIAVMRINPKLLEV